MVLLSGPYGLCSGQTMSMSALCSRVRISNSLQGIWGLNPGCSIDLHPKGKEFASNSLPQWIPVALDPVSWAIPKIISLLIVGVKWKKKKKTIIFEVWLPGWLINGCHFFGCPIQSTYHVYFIMSWLACGGKRVNSDMRISFILLHQKVIETGFKQTGVWYPYRTNFSVAAGWTP